MMGRHLRTIVAAVLLAGAAVSIAPKPRAQARSPIGTNLSRIDDWSPEYAFVDAFKQSRRWLSGTLATFEDTRTIDMDAHGWLRSLQPGQVARTIMFGATPAGRYPSGRYTMTYDGEAAMQWGPSARVVESSPGRIVLDVNAAIGPIFMIVTSVNPANYLRNIHVWMPGTGPSSDIFNPALLNTLRGFRAIRYMNWAVVDGNFSLDTPTLQRTWSDRPTLDDARWSFMRGVPIEVMCALSNRLGADAWFSMSHLADDDYVRRFALLVREQLDPRLKVYIEHSDEIWNYNYAQSRYAQEHGLAAGLSGDPGEAAIRWHARRSREIFGIFETVFPPERLVRVLGSQNGNPWVSSTALNFADTRFHTDALAIAPYMDIRPPEFPRVAGMNLDQLFQELNNNIEPRVMMAARMHADIARAAHVGLIAYEGGQSLVAGGPYAGLNPLFDAANRDPRMGDLYMKFLQDWSDVSGGALMMHFTHCSRWDEYGRFGSLEYLEQPRSQAPRYDALLRWMGLQSGPGPEAPGGLRSSVSGSMVTLNWNASPGATSYDVEAGRQTGGSDVGVFNTPAPTLSGPAGPGRYFVRVRARNSSGTSSASNEIIVSVTSGCGGLTAPSGLTASVSGSEVTLRWIGVPAATSYFVEAGSAPGLQDLASADLGSPATALLATRVRRGTYYVRMRALNDCDTSAPSNEIIVVVP